MHGSNTHHSIISGQGMMQFLYVHMDERMKHAAAPRASLASALACDAAASAPFVLYSSARRRAICEHQRARTSTVDLVR